ncbi:MAG: LolA family protein [Pyrinomonadaceae bacterium]
MKGIIRSAFVTAVVVTAFAAFGGGEARAQGVLREILNRMDAHNKALTSLKADVTMVKTDAVLGESDTSVGVTNYLPKTGKRGMYVRLDWTKPAEERMVVIGDRYQLFRPRLNTVIEGKVDKAKNKGAAGGALAFMGMSKAQLQANYKVNYLGEETVSGGVKAWHLELIPNSKTSYRSAELWVDANGMPVQAKVIEQNNDTTTVLLSKIEKNVKINAQIFDLQLPKNVKKIEG